MMLTFILALALFHSPRRDYEIRYSITYTFPATEDMKQWTISYPNLSSEEANW